jgi:hypothetical protein
VKYKEKKLMFKGFILCDKRTGSTLLQNCMNSHPQITCYDELFMIRGNIKKRNGEYMYRWMNMERGYNIPSFLKYLGEKDENVYLKLIYDQCYYWNVDKYIKENNIKIIHLFRKNHFKKAISRLTRNKSKNEYEPVTDLKVKKIIEETLKSEKKSKDNFGKWRKHKNQIKIYYEEMIGRKEGVVENIEKVGAFNIKSSQITYLEEKTCKDLCEFMEVDYFEMFSNITKRNKEDVLSYFNSDKIKKLEKMLKNAGMENYLKF